MKWITETKHGNCGKREHWKRDLHITIAALNGVTLHTLADQHDLTKSRVSAIFDKCMRDLERCIGYKQVKGMPTNEYFFWTLRNVRPYKDLLIPLLRELEIRRGMTRQTRRIQKAIDELIKIKDDGWGCSSLEHILDTLNQLETVYSQMVDKSELTIV